MSSSNLGEYLVELIYALFFSFKAIPPPPFLSLFFFLTYYELKHVKFYLLMIHDSSYSIALGQAEGNSPIC